MQVNPMSQPPGFSGTPLLERIWPRLSQLIARFWQCLEAEEYEAAEAVLAEIFELAAGRVVFMQIYEELAAALAVALEVVAEGTVILGGGIDIVICIAIISIWAIGCGSKPVYAETGGRKSSAILWRPAPIRRAQEFDELERILFKHPPAARRLIGAPKYHPRSRKAQAAAARMLLPRRAVR
jgi:hypothetical protein